MVDDEIFDQYCDNNDVLEAGGGSISDPQRFLGGPPPPARRSGRERDRSKGASLHFAWVAGIGWARARARARS